MVHVMRAEAGKLLLLLLLLLLSDAHPAVAAAIKKREWGQSSRLHAAAEHRAEGCQWGLPASASIP
jgi:hypothetical protein